MKKCVCIFLLCLTSICGFAQTTAKRVAEFNLDNGLGIQGYDPVGYFEQNKALKGKKEITTTFEGVVYRFSSKENKELFFKHPSKYEPQYGGWCAFAIGDSGEKVVVNPKTFKIVDSKLYLFYNAYFNNTLKDWNKDEVNLKARANDNWKKIIE
ncbi:YHS domain-containing (seleno)protein [Flavobacterium sp.]|uniref:YHS domain-containing (seleno)protein n=1 Tax=Flavobacterium sp. TaxID=239 RepID=UPI003C5495F4